MRVLITGSRDWTDIGTLHAALNNTYGTWKENSSDDPEFVVVHGAARGADTMADEWAHNLGCVESRVTREPYPADWERYGRAAGHKRNQEMLDTSIDLVLAFPLGRSPGTRGCVRLAKKAGIPVKQFQPKLW